MKIKNKYKNTIVEIIEEDDDIENLTEGVKYYRIWRNGEFQLYDVPKVEIDGSIKIPKDTLLNVNDEIENNIKINRRDIKKCKKFWETHSITQYVIKRGFEIIDDIKK